MYNIESGARDLELEFAFVFFGQLLRLAFEESLFVSLASTAGSPLLLTKDFVKTGRLLNIAD